MAKQEPKDTGEALYARFAAKKKNSFGQLPVTGKVLVGDGSSWECPVSEAVKAGQLKLYWLKGGLLALLEGANPTKWESSGTIACDSSIGGVFTEAALAEVKALREEPLETVNEAIDDVVAGDDEEDEGGEGVVKTPAGERFAVFQLPAEGTYQVDRGLDARGEVVALVILIAES